MISLKNLCYAFLVSSILLACSSEDEEYSRGIPAINPQIIEASESVSDEELIGMVEAEDPNGDVLTFGLGADKSGLFKVSGSGEITLIKGKELDFETAPEHQFTVRVTDGKGEFFNYVTVVVLDVDEAPTIEDQTFEVSEIIAANEVFGTVMATHPEGESLTYSITVNDNDLFQISADGELSLATGMSLDFETAEEHDIVVRVSDGTHEAEAQINIKVLPLWEDPASFITSWKIETNDESVVIGLNANYAYDFTVNWGDGTEENIVVANTTEFGHIYAEPGTYNVAIQGVFPAIRMEMVGNVTPTKMKSIEQWGSITWQDMTRAFMHCENMIYNAVDTPNLNNVTEMPRMFSGASSFNGNINGWDVGNVINMGGMFELASSFDQDLNNWDVTSVTNMAGMFDGATSFNGDISSWNVGNVAYMFFMFANTDSFNGNISNWNVANVTDMSAMFALATAFDQSLASWEIGKVTTMTNMLNFSGMSAENFSATIIGWHSFVLNNGGAPTNITLGAEGLTLCGEEAFAAGVSLDVDYGWNISEVTFLENCP